MKEEVDLHSGQEDYFEEINSFNVQKVELNTNAILKTIHLAILS